MQLKKVIERKRAKERERKKESERKKENERKTGKKVLQVDFSSFLSLCSHVVIICDFIFEFQENVVKYGRLVMDSLHI